MKELPSPLHALGEACITYKKRASFKKVTCSNSKTLYGIFLPLFKNMHIAEMVYVVYFNRANETIAFDMNSMGDMSASIINMQKLFAIGHMSFASSFAVCHNHPSGKLIPSKGDIDLTKKLSYAGSINSIILLDHLIISDQGYYSFADEGLI